VRWRCVGLIAATYFYFLIFAQFGFLHRVTETLGLEYWNLVLGVMGLSGVVGALFAASRFKESEGALWLVVSFFSAGCGALFAMIGTHVLVFVVAALVSGFSLAVLTVGLVGVLGNELPVRGIGLVCGIGTGIAYLLSNVPLIFEASALWQCFMSVVACGLGFRLARGLSDRSPVPEARVVVKFREAPVGARWHLAGSVLVFLVLVWADSAAFTQIQETSELKAISWSGSGPLWAIGVVHLFAAIVGGWLMDRGHARLLYVLAFVGLACGLLGLEAHLLGLLPALIYAAAVSLYSVALVAFALVSKEVIRPALAAGVVFGLSGWIGSAMGIGMEQDLGGVPNLFWVLGAALMLLGLWLQRRKVAR
jgi:cytochrome c oxidase cbb3-type subunit 2